MTGRSPVIPHFILDASVLIDYCKSERSILSLVAKHVAVIHIATPIFDEVEQLRMEEATRLGLDLIEPEVDHVTRAAALTGALSFQDNLCLILAEYNHWTCVTNDGKMRKECQARNVKTIWGLEPLILLKKEGAISKKTALNYATKIQETNPRFMTEAILKRFKRIIQN